MTVLQKGIQRFQDEVYPHMQDHFKSLEGGQAPKVFLVTCSDSRVDPSLFLDTKPGDVFVLRNAGNFIQTYGTDSSTDATVEYAIEALNVDHIVVCGHQNCGAVGAALNPDSVAHLPAIHAYVQHAQSCAEKTKDLPEDQRLKAAVSINATDQLDHLMTHPSVQRAVANGSVRLHSWRYDFVSGTITHIDERGVST